MQPQGIVEAVTASLAKAIEHVASKKLGGAIVIALLLASMDAPSWMVFGLGVEYVAAQLALDAWERWLGVREPEN
ncbi:MAG: hypothetical protein OEV33_00315, partial [Armatimonadota bacterium]|nr:hypothetical protein [Armatimonadota bacterium]